MVSFNDVGHMFSCAGFEIDLRNEIDQGSVQRPIAMGPVQFQQTASKVLMQIYFRKPLICQSQFQVILSVVNREPRKSKKWHLLAFKLDFKIAHFTKYQYGDI